MDNYVATDFRGNTFTIGDTVVYPRMSGRSCELQEGIVLAMKPYTEEKFIGFKYPDSRKYEDRIYETVTKYKVKIKPTRNSRGFYRTGGSSVYGYADAAETIPVWVQIGDNVMKA